MRHVFAPLPALLFLAACASSSGRAFTQAEYDDIRIGKTTEAQLREKFGQPSNYAEQKMTTYDFENKKFDPACGKPGDQLKWLAYTRSDAGMSNYKLVTRNFVINKDGFVCNKITNEMAGGN